MNAIKVILIFLIMPVGYAVGFLFTACEVGFCAGRKAVELAADKCYHDLEAKKAVRNRQMPSA
jgi:hypothetical protein